jgi:hypothetical protein
MPPWLLPVSTRVEFICIRADVFDQGCRQTLHRVRTGLHRGDVPMQTGIGEKTCFQCI